MPERFIANPYFTPDSESLRYLPEGPRALQNYPGGGRLGWVAIQHGKESREGSINVLDLASGANTAFPLPGRPGFFAETEQPGVVIVGCERALVYFNLLTGRMGDTLARLDAGDEVIINDGLAVSGGIFFGTKHLEFQRPVAALYFYEYAARRLHTVLDGQGCSNGKYLRRDAAGPLLIDIDSMPRTISEYRLDETLTRVLERRRLMRPPDALPAIPDGLRPCPAWDDLPEGGSVVIAYYNPGDATEGVAQQLRVSDGAVLNEWVLPGSPRVTCPEFVLVDGRVRLLFTTAVEGMPEEMRRRAPGAGALYLAETPFRQLPAPPPPAPAPYHL